MYSVSLQAALLPLLLRPLSIHEAPTYDISRELIRSVNATNFVGEMSIVVHDLSIFHTHAGWISPRVFPPFFRDIYFAAVVLPKQIRIL